MVIYDIDHIEEVYASHYDKYSAVKKLAKEYGVKPSDIFQVLQDNGIIGADKPDKPKEKKEAPAKKKPEKKGKVKRYTEEEIEQIKKWRGEGLTWGEISEKNGRSADALQIKFSHLKRGVPEYREPEIPKVVIPDNVKSANERKNAAESQQNAAEMKADLKAAKQKIDEFIENPKVNANEPVKPALKIGSRTVQSYAVEIKTPFMNFDTLDEAVDFVKQVQKTLEGQASIRILELSEIKIEEDK